MTGGENVLDHVKTKKGGEIIREGEMSGEYVREKMSGSPPSPSALTAPRS